MDWIQKSYDNRKQATSVLLKAHNTKEEEYLRLDIDDEVKTTLKYMSYILDNGDVIYGTESLGFYQIIEIDHKNITYNLPDKREYAIQECADKLGVTVQPYIHVPTNSEITFENGGIVETQQVNDEIANMCNGNMFIKNGKVYLSEMETEDLYEAIQVNGKPLPTNNTEIKKLFKDLFNITLEEV